MAVFKVERHLSYPTGINSKEWDWEFVGNVYGDGVSDARRNAREEFGTYKEIGEIRLTYIGEDEWN